MNMTYAQSSRMTTTSTTTSITTSGRSTDGHDVRDDHAVTRAERLELALAAWQAVRRDEVYRDARSDRHHGRTSRQATSRASACGDHYYDEWAVEHSTDASSSSCGCASSCSCRTSGSSCHSCASDRDGALDTGCKQRRGIVSDGDPFLDETRLVYIPPLLQLPALPYHSAPIDTSLASNVRHQTRHTPRIAAPLHTRRQHTTSPHTMSPIRQARHDRAEAEMQTVSHDKAVQTDNEPSNSQLAAVNAATHAVPEAHTIATQCDEADATTAMTNVTRRVERATSPLAVQDVSSMTHRAVGTADDVSAMQASVSDGVRPAAEQPRRSADRERHDIDTSIAALLQGEATQRAWLTQTEHDIVVTLYRCHEHVTQSVARWQQWLVAARQDAAEQQASLVQRQKDSIALIEAQHAMIDAEQAERHALRVDELETRHAILDDARRARDTALCAHAVEAVRGEAAAHTAQLEQKLMTLQAAYATSSQHEKDLMMQLMQALRLPTVQLVERDTASSVRALTEVDLPVHRRFARAHQEALRATLAQFRHL